MAENLVSEKVDVDPLKGRSDTFATIFSVSQMFGGDHTFKFVKADKPINYK